MNPMIKAPSYLAFTALVLFLFVLPLQAQEPTPCDYRYPLEASNWRFGKGAGLVFTEEGVEAVNINTPSVIRNGTASISNTQGNLIFYSDGIHLWTGSNHLLQGTNDLQGNSEATQSALFVPQPGNPEKIYLFTLDMYIPPVFTDGVRYSIIERTNNSWQFITKNQLLHSANAQKIAAVRHANNNDIWIITHGYGTNDGDTFFAHLLNDTAFIEKAVTSKTGYRQESDPTVGNTFANNTGYMDISPDGSRIALTIPDAGVIEVFDFDTQTGRVSNPQSSGTEGIYYPFGVAFSPDNSKLYITTNPRDNNRPTGIYQFDLDEENVFDNPETIYEVNFNTNTTDTLFGALQLGIDGRVYVAKSRTGNVGKAELGVIYNPNRKGTASNYNHLYEDNNGLHLNGAESMAGLPSFVSSYLDIPHFNIQNHCHTSITAFRLRNEANIDEILWNFGDQGATSDELRSGHIFSEPGVYTVNLTEFYAGREYAYNKDITIHPLPEVDIGQGGDTVFILPNSSITLDAGEFDAYYWEPGGSTERYLDVDQEGVYRVTVTDTNCCVNTDEVTIAFTSIFTPTAFRPGSSISSNSHFKVLGAVSALENFRLYIYNRWGQLVFETSDPHQGWDGSLMNSGQMLPMGTYTWVLYYESAESRYQSRQQVDKRGVVTLIR